MGKPRKILSHLHVSLIRIASLCKTWTLKHQVLTL